MGTYSKSNFGQIIGKVGNAVGGKWRGVDYLRSLPAKSNRKPSPSQLEVQAKLAMSAEKLSPIKDILNLGFGDKKLTAISGYNAAVRVFITNAIVGDYPNLTVDYSKIQLSKGSLGKLFLPVMSYNGNLSIVWAPKVDERTAYLDDRVLVVVYNETTKMYLVDESAVRSDGSVEIDISSTSGDVVYGWIFCINRQTRTVSDSQYLGTFAL